MRKQKSYFLLMTACLSISLFGCHRPSNSLSNNSVSSSREDYSSLIDSESSSNIPSSSEDSSSVEDSSSSVISSSSSLMCDHVFDEEITKEATIIEKGIIKKTCQKCGTLEEEYFYDLKEFSFKNKTFLYDGNERELYIEGMIPYGTTVTYANNKLTEIGSQIATANILDEEGNLLVSKTATLTIVENNGLPNVRVDTANGVEPDYHDKVNYTQMTTSIDNCEQKYVLEEEEGGIRARGNSTNYDVVSKHPWRLKFDSKVNLLGLHGGKSFKSWVLLAEYFDQSLFRNAFALSVGNSLFNYSNNYTSDFKHVNFYMNGEYRGVYLLAEQQQANSNRINVFEPDSSSEQERVGYLLEIDIRGGDDDPYFIAGPASTRNSQGIWSGGIFINGVRVVSSTYAIKTDTVNEAQRKYIEHYISNVMDALIGAVKDGKNQIVNENNELVDSPYETQYETLNSFIDLESFFKICIVHELMKNYDVGFGSFYLFVDFSANSKYPRLTFGAPWDFDLSSGNKKTGNINRTDNDFIKSGFGEANFNPWLYLFSQTDFYDEYVSKYYSVFANSDIFEQSIDLIKYGSTAYATDFANDTERWKDGTGKERMQTRQYSSQAEASTYLEDWLTKRKQYMDSVYLTK